MDKAMEEHQNQSSSAEIMKVKLAQPSTELSLDKPNAIVSQVGIPEILDCNFDKSQTTIMSDSNTLVNSTQNEPIPKFEESQASNISDSKTVLKSTPIPNRNIEESHTINISDSNTVLNSTQNEPTPAVKNKECNLAGNDLENVSTAPIMSPCHDSPVEKLTEVSENTQVTVSDGNSLPRNMCEDSAIIDPMSRKRRVVNIYTADSGPKWYKVTSNLVTPPIIATKLTEAFEYLPIFGTPKTGEKLEDFQNNKIREFVGQDITDEEFEHIAKFCSPENLRTGKEPVMLTKTPSTILLSDDFDCMLQIPHTAESLAQEEKQLCIVKKHRILVQQNQVNDWQKKFKYRGLRLIPFHQEEEVVTASEPLQPGKDLIFRLRIYRPFIYCSRERQLRGRHSVLSRDLVVLGRQWLWELRDRLVCANDVDARIDVSDRLMHPLQASAKDIFPSGFLFINNVFYVDTRPGCTDTSAVVRQWAARRSMGVYPVKDMSQVRVQDLVVKLGHPEVYVHQGSCEHLFVFSEIRVLNATDPLSASSYPCHTMLSQNQTVYCTTCAEFGAKWVVVNCPRVPFDPAFFCDACMKMYLYKDGEKIGEFKVFSFRGNEVNMLKNEG